MALLSEVFITFAAAATALGNLELGQTDDQLWKDLLNSQSGIQTVTRFDTSELDFHEAACINDLDPSDQSNRICKMLPRTFTGLPQLPPETLPIWAGIKGNTDYIEQRARGITATDIYLPAHYRQWIKSELGLSEDGFDINAACASSTVALACAAQLISSGSKHSVLVCAADIVSHFTFTGFASLKALTPQKCRPFDAERDGLCLGDGAVTMLLTSAEMTRKLNLQPLARLSGWGIANDANHITGPARDARGLIQAIRSALDESNLQPSALQAFCAHGTGTPYNDAMELTAVESIFGKTRFPVFSVKGAIGHTLGPAGAIEAIIASKALQEKITPPTVGLNKPEERGTGRCLATSQTFSGDNILTTNSGFGGCNAALILESI